MDADYDLNASFIIKWTPYVNIDEYSNKESIRLRIYDAGDIRGFLIQNNDGKEKWYLCKIISCINLQNGTIEEKGYLLSDNKIPLHFFSSESYDAIEIEQLNNDFKVSNLEVFFSGWKFKIQFSYPQEQVSVSLPQPSLLGPPPQDLQPLEQHQKSSLPVTPKLHPAKLKQLPRKMLDKNKASSKMSAPLISSN